MNRQMKQVYLGRASEDLLMLGDRLDRLRAGAERLANDRRLVLEPALDALRGLRNRAEAKIEDIRRAPDDAWQAFKVHADKAIDELRAAVERAEDRMARIAA